MFTLANACECEWELRRYFLRLLNFLIFLDPLRKRKIIKKEIELNSFNRVLEKFYISSSRDSRAFST